MEMMGSKTKTEKNEWSEKFAKNLLEIMDICFLLQNRKAMKGAVLLELLYVLASNTGMKSSGIFMGLMMFKKNI